LFTNPEAGEHDRGPRVRTRVVSRKENLDFEIGLMVPAGVLSRIIVETTRPGRGNEPTVIQFTLSNGQARRKGKKIRQPKS
jgi:hypothetical protein